MGLIGEVFADAGLHIDQASFAQYASALRGAESGISNFSNSTKTMIAGAFALPATALAGIAAYGTTVASNFEDAGTTLTTLYGDLDIAKEKFNWLADFAASTPFEFPELLDASVKLKAYGIEAQQYMGVIGDTSAAMGKSVDMTTEAIADAMTGEFERMKEYGIKAVEVTNKNFASLGVGAEQAGKTALTYVDKYGKQQVEIVDRNNREMVLSTITAIWNEKYAGAMEQRSKTLSGLMSTLKDNLSIGLAEMIGYDMKNMEVETLSLLGAIKSLAEVAVWLTSGFKDMSEPMQTFLVLATAGGAAALALAGGVMAASVAGITMTTVTTAFGFALNAALLPITGIVLAAAVLAAGLVYLEERTGLVSGAFSLLYDMATIVWYGLKDTVSGSIDWITDKIKGFIDTVSGIADALGLEGVASAISGIFDSISGSLGGFTERVHAVAQDYKTASGEIETSTADAASSVEDAEGSAEKAHESWLDDIFGLADGAKQGYGDVANAAQEVKSSYDKAVEEMNAGLEQKQEAQIKVAVGIDTAEFERGVQLVDGSLLILNENGELVHHTLEGVDERLTELGDHNFETTRGSISVLVSDGSNIEQVMTRADNIVNETGNDVVVLDTSIKNLDGNQLVGLNGQIVTVQDSMQNTFTLVDNLSGNFVELNGQNLSGINGQIQGVDSATTTATGKVGTWEEYLASVNVQPLSTLQGNIMTSGSMVDSNNQKTSGWNLTMGQTNASPFGMLQGNLTATGGHVDTDNQKTGGWNTTLGQTNASPFGMLLGNLITSGGHVDTDNNKTGTWNTTLGRTNASPFATLHGNLTTSATKVDTVNTRTGTANITLGKMGSMSFSTTISGLGSIVSKLESGIIAKAKEAYEWLQKVAGAKVSSGSSGGGGGGASGVTRSGSSGTGETNVKVNTVNINNHTATADRLKSIVG